MEINKEFSLVKTLYNSNKTAYDYLIEKNGYFLDHHRTFYITSEYLLKLLNREVFAPLKANSENWEKKVPITKLELFYKVEDLLTK